MAYSYDRRTARDSASEILKRINKVRASTHPPSKPLAMADLNKVLKIADELDGKLREVFGYDHRLIILGNGTHIHE